MNNSQTKAEELKASTEYTEANERMKRRSRADKQKFVKQLTMKARKAERGRNVRNYIAQLRNEQRKIRNQSRTNKNPSLILKHTHTQQ